MSRLQGQRLKHGTKVYNGFRTLGGVKIANPLKKPTILDKIKNFFKKNG